MAPDQRRLPNSALRLLAHTDRWAVGDDYERDRLVMGARTDELVDLVAAVDAADDDFWAWLSGPESFAAEPSVDYIRLTELTMAADLARLKLAKRQLK